MSLGHDEQARRRASVDDDGTTRFERFLGARLHGFTTIVRVERGSGFIVTSAGRVPLAAGDTAVLPPGSIGYAFAGPRRAAILAIRTAVHGGTIVKTAHLPDDLFERPDRDVVESLRAAPAVARFARTSYERSVMHALRSIDARPSSARLGAVAHELGYTADGLRALLVRHTGAGFAAWREALMMAHVRSSLGMATPVSRIARDLGLERNYLHRRFARAHGVTPSTWRKAPAVSRSALAHDWDSVVRYVGDA